MKLIKDITSVLLSNIANFGTSFVVGFILPSILTVSSYGFYRQYILYISFTYLFNIGYNDGIFIKYGGKESREINTKSVIEEHTFIIVYQLIILIIMFSIGLYLKNLIFILFSITTFFNTLVTYHQNLLKAIGEFNIYSRGNIVKSFFNIFLLIIAIYLIKSDNYIMYIMINVLSFIFLFFYYEISFFSRFGFYYKLNMKNKSKIFKVGIFILFANMGMSIVANLGNWVVNFGFPIEDFAQYSFQNSILNVSLLVVNAVSLVFYNVISKNIERRSLIIIKKISLFLGMYSGIFYFLFEMIIKKYLPQYESSLNIMSLTFLSIPYLIASKILFTNIYKAEQKETKYFLDSLLYTLFSLIIVVMTYYLTNSLSAIALSTTISYMTWYFYCSQLQFSYLKNTFKDIILLLSYTIMFYISSALLGGLKGAIFYISYLVLITIFVKNDIKIIFMNINLGSRTSRI